MNHNHTKLRYPLHNMRLSHSHPTAKPLHLRCIVYIRDLVVAYHLIHLPTHSSFGASCPLSVRSHIIPHVPPLTLTAVAIPAILPFHQPELCFFFLFSAYTAYHDLVNPPYAHKTPGNMPRTPEYLPDCSLYTHPDKRKP